MKVENSKPTPAKPIAFETTAYKMMLLADGTTLELIWHNKLIDVPTFKSSVEFYASLAEEYSVPHLLVDARLSRFVMPPAVQVWHDHAIVPRYVRAGVRAIAFVIPNSIFSELTHRQTFEKKNAAEKLPSAFFLAREDAFAWLKTE